MSSALLASVTVDLDKSVLVQMALFGVLILDSRPALVPADASALRFARAAQPTAHVPKLVPCKNVRPKLLANYESEVARIKATASAERDALRRETAALEASMLAEARAAADLLLAEGRQKMADDFRAGEGRTAGAEGRTGARYRCRVLGRGASVVKKMQVPSLLVAFALALGLAVMPEPVPSAELLKKLMGIIGDSWRGDCTPRKAEAMPPGMEPRER